MAAKNHLYRKRFDECDVLPESYGITNITLIARDPYWIYAYWEVSPQALKQAKNNLKTNVDDRTLTIRLYDVTLVDFNGYNANYSFDIKINDLKGQQYINLCTDNVNYCADIGLKTANGDFHALARSNDVLTQRPDWANNFQLQWGKTSFDKKGRPVFIDDLSQAPSNGKARKRRRDISDTELNSHHSWNNLPKKLVEQTHKTRKSLKPLSADEIIAYYARLFPRLRKIKPKLLQRLKRKGLWNESIEDDIDTFGLLQTKGLSPVTKDLFFKKPRSGASAEFDERGASSDINNISGASENNAPGGSSELVYKTRKFFFELHTEVVVYGRTEPDAEVWWGDEKIELRKDGTFSLRFNLNDGNIPLEFRAISNDKLEQRNIATAVERIKTNYLTEVRPQ